RPAYAWGKVVCGSCPMQGSGGGEGRNVPRTLSSGGAGSPPHAQFSFEATSRSEGGMGRLMGACATLLTLVSSAATAQELTDPPLARPVFPNFHLGVFGNIDFVVAPPENETVGFRNGALDLFATSQLSERWSGLIELLFSNTSGGLVTSLERIQIAYDHADELRLSAGRLHNPLIHWNIVHH